MTSGVSIQVDFHGAMQKTFGEKSARVNLRERPTVGVLLKALSTNRERRERMFDKTGGLRRDLNIFRNGRNISFLSGLETELSDGDVVAIFPPTFGG